MSFFCNSNQIAQQVVQQEPQPIIHQEIPVAAIAVGEIFGDPINAAPLPPIAPNPTTQSSFLTRSFLIRFGTNAQIREYLRLDEWQTEGRKEDAITNIIQNFRTKNRLLNLSDLGISTLPSNLDLPWLKDLLINGNQISDLSPLTGKLPRLVYLEASENNLQDLTSLRAFPSLTDLYLNQNPIRDLSPLADLRNLRTLYLSRNEVGGSTGIQNLQILDRLYHLRLLKMTEMRGNLLALDTACERLTFGHRLSCEWTNGEGISDTFNSTSNLDEVRNRIAQRQLDLDLNHQNFIENLNRTEDLLRRALGGHLTLTENDGIRVYPGSELEETPPVLTEAYIVQSGIIEGL